MNEYVLVYWNIYIYVYIGCSWDFYFILPESHHLHRWKEAYTSYIWSNYSDLTRPHPKWWLSKWNPLISGKPRLAKYYNLARYMWLLAGSLFAHKKHHGSWVIHHFDHLLADARKNQGGVSCLEIPFQLSVHKYRSKNPEKTKKTKKHDNIWVLAAKKILLPSYKGWYFCCHWLRCFFVGSHPGGGH